MTQPLREMLRDELVSVLSKYTNVDIVIEDAIDNLIGAVEDADEESKEDLEEKKYASSEAKRLQDLLTYGF
jgi:septum formation topological specificity factor MinE